MRTVRIGKSPDNDIVLYNDSVSRNHAVLLLDDDGRGGVLRDLNSTNGTFVNSYQVMSDTRIGLNDYLCFGTENTTLAQLLTLLPQQLAPAPQAYGVQQAAPSGGGDDDVLVYESVEPQKPERRGFHLSAGLWLLGAAAAVVVGVVLVLLSTGSKKKSMEEIYKDYNSAVVMIYVQYGYQVLFDGEDITPLFGVNQGELLMMDGGEFIPASSYLTFGTGFFISDDGMIATNLHVARPWLYEETGATIEQAARDWLAQLGPDVVARLNTLRVTPHVTLMGIIPNGLPESDDNMVMCSEYAGHDNTDKDCAILQTNNRELPSRVKAIIDYKKANSKAEAYKEGKVVYTIGFPYATNFASVNKTSNQDLKNQIHQGHITQDLGQYEFAHDAATASGASGSPILDEEGRLIGIHHAGLTGVTGAQGFNQAIKVRHILSLIDDDGDDD